jgi:hypothetical protein
MRTRLICCALLVSACGPTTRPPVAASLPVIDPGLALTELPDDPTGLRISKDGLRAHLLHDIRMGKIAADTIAGEKGLREVAQEQRDEAVAGYEAAAGWQRWGPIGIVGAFVAGALAGVVAVVAVRR